jgi:hypothetical protein
MDRVIYGRETVLSRASLVPCIWRYFFTDLSDRRCDMLACRILNGQSASKTGAAAMIGRAGNHDDMANTR